MDIKDYQGKAKRTLNNTEKGALLYANMGLGITGEAGEVADVIKKHVCHGHSEMVAKAAITEELGDLLWYTANVATVYGLDLSQIAEANIAKLQKRYPHGFSSGDSIKRVDVDEPGKSNA